MVLSAVILDMGVLTTCSSVKCPLILEREIDFVAAAETRLAVLTM